VVEPGTDDFTMTFTRGTDGQAGGWGSGNCNSSSENVACD